MIQLAKKVQDLAGLISHLIQNEMPFDTGLEEVLVQDYSKFLLLFVDKYRFLTKALKMHYDSCVTI